MKWFLRKKKGYGYEKSVYCNCTDDLIHDSRGGLISKVFSLLLGGGLEQSYLYPIYGGIILLAGVVVGASQLVIDEIKKLEKLLDDKKKDA